MLLDSQGYHVERVRLSKLIAAQFPEMSFPEIDEGVNEGRQKLLRARQLQDLGDSLREQHGGFAVASLSISEIMRLRGDKATGTTKIAFLIDSIKHEKEIELYREVYGQSFRLIGVHCDRSMRESRLIGANITDAKYRGARAEDVLAFMDRDEKDGDNLRGQRVRDAFYLADYFIDNNAAASKGANLTSDLRRFVDLVLGVGLVRPTIHEKAINHAHAAALQSACLSRQVGAVLVSKDGEVVATGTNEAPKFGGGVYSEGSSPDHRCFKWEWDPETEKFKGCHNDRKKAQLRGVIGRWLADSLAEKLAEAAHPIPQQGIDTANASRKFAIPRIRDFLERSSDIWQEMPGIKDLIEYSRAIHAEMDALLSAARSGTSTAGGTLYCTTYPCHNCARHLVAAGVHKVFYVEPYVKSLATELHSDSIANEQPSKSSTGSGPRMTIVPFTGVGWRMYEDCFSKVGSLKGHGGKYDAPPGFTPSSAVRLLELPKVESAAAALVAKVGDDGEGGSSEGLSSRSPA
jgi:deoxycytidylate deaminase